jgi:D-alanine-D-alanine ligase
VVRSPEDLEREVRTVLQVYREPALIEEFLTGREFTVAMMGNGDDVRILPIVEIRFDGFPEGANPIYSYEAKWVWDTRETPLDIFCCPADIPDSLKNEIENICRDAYRVLRCRDWTRIDVRCDSRGRPLVMELNPLPGILPRPEDHSCFPKAARAAGLSYSQLINAALDISLERWGFFGPNSQGRQTAKN